MANSGIVFIVDVVEEAFELRCVGVVAMGYTGDH